MALRFVLAIFAWQYFGILAFCFGYFGFAIFWRFVFGAFGFAKFWRSVLAILTLQYFGVFILAICFGSLCFSKKSVSFPIEENIAPPLKLADLTSR